MIHVAYGLRDADGRYSKFCGTSIVSIFENTTSPVTVHILHDETLTPDNRDKFMYLAGQYGQHIKLCDVNVLAAQRVRFLRESFAEHHINVFFLGMLYRLLLPELIPQSIHKMIYIDAGDTVINFDIKTLWKIELGTHPLAAVLDNDRITNEPLDRELVNGGFVKFGNYFNSGVIVINLEHWRNNLQKIWDGYMFWLKNFHRLPFSDQDILNYCFADDAIQLPYEFNCFVEFERKSADSDKLKRKLYHFAGPGKPTLDSNDIFNRLYLEYFAKTPWFNADIFGGLLKTFNDIYNGQKQFLLHITRVLGKRRRAFFADSGSFPMIKTLFDVGDDEPMIDTRQPDALDRLLQIQSNTRGERSFSPSSLFQTTSTCKNC